MSGGIVVYGAGGHGKVVADALLVGGMRLAGFIDDARAVGTLVLGAPVLGTWESLRPGQKVALGIGSNDLRARIATICQERGVTLVSVIHPTATLARSATIAEGVVVFAQAVVNADAVVRRGAIINTGAIVEHDCVVGAFAHVSPRAVLGGSCHVGDHAQLGIGAIMLPGRSIGARALIGGGATVVRNIGADAVAVGTPAHPVSK